MVYSFPEEQYLKEKAHALRTGLFFRLEEFVDDFPTGSPGKLIDILKRILTAASDSIEAASDKRILILVYNAVHTLSEALDWLDNAHVSQTPRGLADFLDRIASMLAPSSMVLVAPSSKYNYSITDLVPWLTHFAQILVPPASQGSILSQLPQNLYLIQFPRIERENVLGHAVFGHEFGHPIAARFLQNYIATTEGQTHAHEAAREIAVVFQTELSALPPLGQMKAKMRHFQVVSQIHKRAIEELVSDAVGVFLFGPSALFALSDLFCQTELDQLPERGNYYYPPSRFRLREMHSLLEENGHLKALNELPGRGGAPLVSDAARSVLEYIGHLIADDLDRKNIGDEPHVSIAYRWVNKCLHAGHQYAQSEVGTLLYTVELATREISPLIDRLKMELPPSEIGIWPDETNADWRSAILSAWVMKFHQATNAGLGSSERRKKVVDTQRLALKGVEYCLLRDLYKKSLSPREEGYK